MSNEQSRLSLDTVVAEEVIIYEPERFIKFFKSWKEMIQSIGAFYRGVVPASIGEV